jgi:hypothetical protein
LKRRRRSGDLVSPAFFVLIHEVGRRLLDNSGKSCWPFREQVMVDV